MLAITPLPLSDLNVIASTVAVVIAMVLLGWGLVHSSRKYRLTSREERKFIREMHLILDEGPGHPEHDEALAYVYNLPPRH